MARYLHGLHVVDLLDSPKWHGKYNGDEYTLINILHTFNYCWWLPLWYHRLASILISRLKISGCCCYWWVMVVWWGRRYHARARLLSRRWPREWRRAVIGAAWRQSDADSHDAGVDPLCVGTPSHISRTRTVCSRCVFACALSDSMIDWRLLRRRHIYVVFHLKQTENCVKILFMQKTL